MKFYVFLRLVYTLYMPVFLDCPFFLLPLRMMTAKIVGTETKRYLPTYNAYILTLNLSKQK